MNPSDYNKFGNWNNALARSDIDFEVASAIRIFTIRGEDEPALALWRTVRSFGTPVLQQYVWRLLLTNGIFIVRAKDGTLRVERPDATHLTSQETAWFVGANVLRAKKDGEEFDVYLDYDFIHGILCFKERNAKDDKVVEGCAIVGVVPDSVTTPSKTTGFYIPEEQ